MADIIERLQPHLADRYLIERELGRGGMATVFLAKDIRHFPEVASDQVRWHPAGAETPFVLDLKALFRPI